MNDHSVKGDSWSDERRFSHARVVIYLKISYDRSMEARDSQGSQDQLEMFLMVVVVV
jgi:hypothetical protein